jgi:hypothetical protein
MHPFVSLQSYYFSKVLKNIVYIKNANEDMEQDQQQKFRQARDAPHVEL